MEKEVSKKSLKPLNLKEFYNIIYKTKNPRKRILKKILSKKEPLEKDIEILECSLEKLKNTKKQNDYFILKYGDEKILSKLKYEIDELEKDVIYLRKGEKALLNYLSKINKGFQRDINTGVKYLENKNIDCFITDRDGTINNYCERYLTSVQSVYNAVFLLRFMSSPEETFIIITSGPLKEFEKVNIMPKKGIVYAGSKGREICFNGRTKKHLLSKKDKKIMSDLLMSIKSLFKKKKYKKFFIKGSGFQKKIGEVSISRQDFLNSIPEKESKNFLELIKKISKNAGKNKLVINDTGLDIEIILKKGKNAFDKGDGINFILKNLKISPKKVLVCGNSFSDLSLLKEALEKFEKVYSIFVAENKKLKSKVKKLNPDSIFVSSPDSLITILYKKSKLLKSLDKENGI